MHSVLRILRSTGALWPLYAGIIACSVLTALATLVGPFLIRDATDAIVGALSGGTPSDDEISRVTRTVAALAGGLLAANLLQTVVRNIGGYWGDVMAARMREILSTRYFAKLLSLPQRYFDNQVTGTIIARLDRSITNVTQFMQSASNNFSPMLVTVAAVLGITVLHWWPLAVLLALVFPTYLWLTALTSRRWLVFEKDKNDEVDHAGGRFAEVVGQVKAVRSYVAEVREVAVFGRRYDRTVALTRRQSRWWHLMDSLRGSLLNLIFFGIYLLLFLRTLNGGFSIGTMVMLIQLVAMVRTPAEMMSYMIDTAQRAVAGSRDYFAVMEMDSEPAAPRELARAASASSRFGDLDRGRTPAGPLPVPEEGPAVEFDDVSFAYEGDDEVIHGVTFSARPGEHVALVGESGGGKSTLVNLLLGFYAPTGGTLRVCGADAAHTPMDSPGEHRVRPPRRHRRGDRGRRPPRQCRRVHPEVRRRLRHRHRRARRAPVRRPAAARGHRAGDPQGRPRAHPRRGDLRPGHQGRARGPARTRGAHGGADGPQLGAEPLVVRGGELRRAAARRRRRRGRRAGGPGHLRRHLLRAAAPDGVGLRRGPQAPEGVRRQHLTGRAAAAARLCDAGRVRPAPAPRSAGGQRGGGDVEGPLLVVDDGGAGGTVIVEERQVVREGEGIDDGGGEGRGHGCECPWKCPGLRVMRGAGRDQRQQDIRHGRTAFIIAAACCVAVIVGSSPWLMGTRIAQIDRPVQTERFIFCVSPPRRGWADPANPPEPGPGPDTGRHRGRPRRRPASAS